MSLSGHVNQPGNYELPHGITWRELIYEIGGGITGDKELKAWIPGGASAPWFVPAEHLDLEITKDATAAAGSMLGSGAVIVMDEDTCMVRAAERVVRFFSHESCGQCTPCREGTTWLEMILQRIEQGQGRAVDLGPDARCVRRDQHRSRLASEDDDDLSTRTVGGVTDFGSEGLFPLRSGRSCRLWWLPVCRFGGLG